MASILACLAKLVASGKITQAQANAAQAIYQGAQGTLNGQMPPTNAMAMAALTAARAMHASAQARKLSIAKQAIALSRSQQFMINHKQGRTAGLMALLNKGMPGQEGTVNVEAHSEVIWGQLMREAGTLVDSYQSKFAGFWQDKVGIRNVVRELFGQNTGDSMAQQAAAGWEGAVKKGFARYRAAGNVVADLQDWRLPQFWDGSRLRKAGEQEFINDIYDAVQKGELVVMDKKNYAPAAIMDVPNIAKGAFEKIRMDDRGTASAISNETRVFRFQNPEAYLRFMDKYGAGQGGIYGMMTGYLHNMAREIALSEVLGPDHAANFNSLLKMAKVEDLDKSTLSKFTLTRPFASPRAAEMTYKWLTGELNAVQSDLVAGIWGGIRSINTAAMLAGATVAAVPGDSVTAILAARHVGMGPVRVFTRALTGGNKKLARRLNVVTHGIMDGAVGIKRFENEIVGRNLPARLAQAIMRVSGLNAWTNLMKRSFTMEFLGHVADQSKFAWADLDRHFRDFLTEGGFNAAEWDVIRQTPTLIANGAEFFDLDQATDKALGEKLMGALIDMRTEAVIEPSARIRQVSALGSRRGTMAGEIGRSAFLFKSFPMTMALTHFYRATVTGPYWSRPFRLATLIGLTTIGGAASLQARALLQGKDPENMKSQDFWYRSMLVGGAMGIYGDFINSSVSRSGHVLSTQMIGPPVQMGDDMMALFLNRGSDSDSASKFGERLAKFVKKYTPGSTLWYTRLLADRYVFDTLQETIDPNYRRSFRKVRDRAKKMTGQKFWFGPGDDAPKRAPNLGKALP